MHTPPPPEQPAPAPQWAIIELNGHIKYGGIVSKDTVFGGGLLRVEVPDDDGTGFTTQLVNPNSLYRLTFACEALARAAAREGNPMPFNSWDLEHLVRGKLINPQPQLPFGGEDEDDGN